MINTKKSIIYNEQLFKKRIEDSLFNKTTYFRSLELAFQDYFKYRYARAVCSWDTAFEIALNYVKIKYPAANNIIIPSFDSGLITSKTLKNFKPLFCDINDNFCLDPAGFELRKDLASACVVENKFGNLYDYERINDLYTIVSGSLNTCGIYGDDYSFTFGDCQIFNFDSHDLAGSFGGAIIATNDDNLATFIDMHVYSIMSELQSAAILTQIENLEEIQADYYDSWAYYNKNLPAWIQPVQPNAELSNFSVTTCYVDSDLVNELGMYLLNLSIPVNFGFKMAHKLLAGYDHINLPKSAEICKKLICLPNNVDVKYVIDKIKEFK